MDRQSPNSIDSSGRILEAAVTLAATALISLLVFGLSHLEVWKGVELQGYDLLVSMSGPTDSSSRVIIVDFDDESVRRLNAFPLPRALLADVLDRVSSGGPAVVGLDVILDQRRLPSDDLRLSDAIDRAGNVVLVSEYGFGGLGRNEPLSEFEAKAAGVAFGDLPQDPDGAVRRMLLLLNEPNYKRFSFPVAMSVYATEKPLKPGGPEYLLFGSTVVPLATRDPASALIGFRSHLPAQSIPVTELLKSEFDSRVFKDKVVLIGQSSEFGRDLFMTPVFHFRRPAQGRTLLSGAEIHAAAISTLLEGRFPRKFSASLTWTCCFVLALMSFLSFTRLRWFLAVTSLLIAITAVFFLAVMLFSRFQLWAPYVGAEACLLLACPAGFGYRYLEERAAKRESEAERKQLMSLFERYVSDEAAAEIWRRRDQFVLAGEERVATVLFSDIRSFTALTAGKPSAQVLAWLNRYLTSMATVVKANNGFLNKFIGDGIMVIFGVPVSHGEHEDACSAVKCALAMLREVGALNAQNNGDPPLQIGIGIHTGVLTAGNVGSPDRLEYSVIGETVNLASRLEALTKNFHSEIVISPRTWELVRKHFVTQPLGESEVRGFSGKIMLYGVTENRAVGATS